MAALLAVCILASLSCGCVTADTRKHIADSQATIYDAAVSIEQGPVSTGPMTAALAVIKANAQASAKAVGYDYPAPTKK